MRIVTMHLGSSSNGFMYLPTQKRPWKLLTFSASLENTLAVEYVPQLLIGDGIGGAVFNLSACANGSAGAGVLTQVSGGIGVTNSATVGAIGAVARGINFSLPEIWIQPNWYYLFYAPPAAILAFNYSLALN